MKTIIIIFTVLIGLSLAIYNGWIYKMATKRDANFNRQTHFVSGIVRFLIMLLNFFLSWYMNYSVEWIIWIELLSAVMFWPVYNVTYNAVFRESIFYLGSKETNTKSWLDKTLGKLILPLQGILILMTVLWFPMDIYQGLVDFLNTFQHQLVTEWYNFVIAAILIALMTYGVKKIRKNKKSR